MSYTRENAGTYKPEWGKMYLGTPVRWWNVLNQEFAFDLDVAADEQFHMTDKYFTFEQNALKQDWRGKVWMSPPWATEVIHYWVEKAVRETILNHSTVVCLLPVRTDTRWWHDTVLQYAHEIRFIDGNLKYQRMDREGGYYSVEPSCLVVFTPGSGEQILVTSYPSTAKRKR